MSDDSVIARRIDYRVVRPDGTLVWTHVTSSVMPHEPSLRPDGWFDAGFDLCVAPPLLIQRRDGDDWVTIERSGAWILVYRFVRPDGKVMHQWTMPADAQTWPPLVRSDGWAYWGDHSYFPPPWLLQVDDGGEWRTLDRREV